MVFRSTPKVLPQNMSAISAVICRVPNARISIPAEIGASPRTVENWLSGATEPNASYLIALMAKFDVVADWVIDQAGRADKGITFEQRSKIMEARKLLAVLGEE